MSVQARGAATGQRPDGEPGVTLRATADSWFLRRRSAEQIVGGDAQGGGQGLTLAQVASRAAIDVSTLSRLESGKRRLALDHVPAIRIAGCHPRRS